MQLLDADDDVVSYEYEPFFLPYIGNVRSGKLRKYLPDFLIHRKGGDQLVEVKPKKKLAQLIVKKKLDAARSWCVDNNAELLIVTEDYLKEHGVL